MLLFPLLVACQDNPVQTGVAGTGNAGRITGVVSYNGSGILASTRLLRYLDDGSAKLVASRPTDSAGSFLYDSIQQGTYLVEAWQEGQLRGRSQKFFLRDSISNLVVVLLQPQRITLDLRSLGTVDSAYLDYPGNTLSLDDSLWTAQNLRGDSGTLYTKIRDESGVSTWLRWKLNTSNGRLSLSSLSGISKEPSGKIDTGAFFVTKHTLALWTFDSLAPGNRIKDLSGQRNDLVFPSGKYLVPSPYGKALDLSLLPNEPNGRLVGDSIPQSLWWWTTKHQTIRIRLQVGRNLSLIGTLFGMTSSFRISINPHYQVQIENAYDPKNPRVYFCTYFSPQNAISPEKWSTLTLYRDVENRSFTLWIDDQAVPLYSHNPDLPEFFGDQRDSLVFTYFNWNRHPPFQIDEIEFSDSIPQIDGFGTQPASRIFVEANSAHLNLFSFSEMPADSSRFAMDSSDTVDLGHGRDLYLRYRDFGQVVDRDVSQAQLVLQVTGSPPVQFQKFTAHRVLSGFFEKQGTNAHPKPGIDFDTAAISTAYAFKTNDVDYINFDLTKIANQWSRNRDTLGFVIRAADQSLPKIRINTKASHPFQPTQFSIWVN